MTKMMFLYKDTINREPLFAKKLLDDYSEKYRRI